MKSNVIENAKTAIVMSSMLLSFRATGANLSLTF